MMVWNIEFTKEAQKDIRKLREPSKSHVNEAINKVAQNPLPFTEGGYGKPLGHKRDGNLTGYLKVKLRGEGLRVVYRLERTVHSMTVVVVSVRDDNTVYKEAARRIKKDLALCHRLTGAEADDGSAPFAVGRTGRSGTEGHRPWTHPIQSGPVHDHAHVVRAMASVRDRGPGSRMGHVDACGPSACPARFRTASCEWANGPHAGPIMRPTRKPM